MKIHRSFEVLKSLVAKKELSYAIKNTSHLATEACAYLEQRFNVSGIIKDLDVLDATNWPTTANDRNKVVGYGQAEMSRILDHFVSFYPESIRRQAENQWLQIKFHVCKKVPLSDRNSICYGQKCY